MNRSKLLILTAFAAFGLTACEPAANTASNNNAAARNTANATANSNVNSTAAAAPTKESLMKLETSAFEAWKNKDLKFWDTFLASNLIGFGPNGERVDKAAMVKMFETMPCDVKSVTTSDDQMTQLGPDAALLTYKAAQDASCGGQKVPANSWVATVFVREGGQWKAVTHGEVPIRDPNAKPDTVAPAKPAPAVNASPAAAPDAATEAMFALEKKVWDAWKSKDAKVMEEWSSPNMVAFTDKGRETRAATINTWTTDGCQVKSTTLSDPASTSVGPDYGLLIYKATVDGKCGGSAVPPMHGTTVYAKESGTWKALFSMNMPAQ